MPLRSLFCILFLVVSSSSYAQGCKHAPFGLPANIDTTDKVVYHLPLCVVMDAKTRFADVVLYTVTKSTASGSGTTRVYRPDPKLSEDMQIEPDDYRGSNKVYSYEKGHLAALGVLDGYSDEDRAAVNYTSNLAPQYRAFNRLDSPWYDIEEAERKYVQTYPDAILYIMTGTLYEHKMPNLLHADEPHIVPSGFWKVITSYNEGSYNFVSFIIDQDTPNKDNAANHIVSIDEIERRTGLDLLPNLDENIEIIIESKVHTSLQNDFIIY